MRDLIDIIESISPIEFFSEGGCFALALAHWRLYGWPVFLLGYAADELLERPEPIALGDVADDDLKSVVEAHHAMNLHPSGKLLDASGLHTIEEAKQAWGEDFALLALGSGERIAHLFASDGGHAHPAKHLSLAMDTVKGFMRQTYPEVYEGEALTESENGDDVDFDGSADLETHVRSIMAYLEGQGYEAHEGRTRTAFIKGRRVIKVPRNFEGIRANQIERKAFLRSKANDKAIPVAACRMFYFDEAIGIPMLMMEFVTHECGLVTDPDAPWWVGFVDCGQVGRNKAGRLVAYDL